MRVAVGSTNPVKVSAVRAILPQYELFKGADIIPVEVDSGVSAQPKTLDETVLGAAQRAFNAKRQAAANYGIGLEAGLMFVQNARTWHMNVCVCAIYDGKQPYALGLGPGFEYPDAAMKLMREQGLDANQAFQKAGLTNNPELGSAEGAIGLLTNGRFKREDSVKLSIRMAMIQLEHPDWYPPK